MFGYFWFKIKFNVSDGLLLVAARAPFSTRLSVANGIFNSKLCYLVQLWGGAEGYLLHSLQVIQNRAARAVTMMSWFTPSRILLKKCGWLSVKQLVFYHRVLTAHKIVQTQAPMYLHQKMITSHPYQTRQATDGAIRFGEQFDARSELTRSEFCYIQWDSRLQPNTSRNKSIQDNSNI